MAARGRDRGAATPGVAVSLVRLLRLVSRQSPEAALGMTLKQYLVLAYLRDNPVLTQQSLGEALCVDANYLVLVLNELESAELVARRRDPTDRRRHLVEITDHGRAAVAHAEAVMQGVEAEVLVALGEGERRSLADLLARAVEGSRAAPTAPVGGGATATTGPRG